MYFCFHTLTNEVYIVLLLKICSFTVFRNPGTHTGYPLTYTNNSYPPPHPPAIYN